MKLIITGLLIGYCFGLPTSGNSGDSGDSGSYIDIDGSEYEEYASRNTSGYELHGSGYADLNTTEYITTATIKDATTNTTNTTTVSTTVTTILVFRDDDSTVSTSDDTPEERKTVYVLFISIFAGYTGADWFYLSYGKYEYILIGLVKLGLGIASIVMFFLFRVQRILLWEYHVLTIKIVLMYLCWFLAVIWWLGDLLRIGLDDCYFKDSYHRCLK